MSIDWERSTHPDLLEEEQSARAQAEEAAPASPPERNPPRGRGRSRAARSTEAPAGPAAEVASGPEAVGSDTVASSPEPTAETPPQPPETGDPEWLRQVREASDPPTALAAILKNTPIEELQKDPRIAGWIGDMAQKRARALAQEQAQAAEAQAKTEAWQRGDYYRLGELSATEQEARALQAQAQQASAPFLQSVEEFQRTLPVEAQQAIQGKSYNSVAEYMQAAVDAAASHRLEAAVQAEIKKREPALRKAELSASVGAEPSPERDGGRAPHVREITGEQVGRMTDAEYDAHFDSNGRPKPGVLYRITERDIPVRQR